MGCQVAAESESVTITLHTDDTMSSDSSGISVSDTDDDFVVSDSQVDAPAVSDASSAVLVDVRELYRMPAILG